MSKTTVCALEMWAMWCQNGGEIRQTSMLGKFIENAGFLTFGSATGKDPECFESKIERIVSKLFKENPEAANALRVHYGAKDWKDARKSPAAKAKKCGVSLSKYYRLVNTAKKYVDTNINLR